MLVAASTQTTSIISLKRNTYTNCRGCGGRPNTPSDSMLAVARGATSMGAAVSSTRRDLTALELRRAAGGEKDGSAARRMLALALVLDGSGRKTAAETCGMDRQTVRDWVHRYNAEGVAGLRNLKSPGPRSKLTAPQQAELAGLIEADPGVCQLEHTERISPPCSVQLCCSVRYVTPCGESFASELPVIGG